MKLSGCFIAGTLVHTKEGLVPIEKIKVGDHVLSKPEDGSGEPAYKRVINTFKHEDKEVMLVDIFAPKPMWKGPSISEAPPELNDFLVATPNHPFWVQNIGWTEVRALYTHGSEMSCLQFISGDTAILRAVGPLCETPLAPGQVWFVDPEFREMGVVPVDYSYSKVQAYTNSYEPSPDLNMGYWDGSGELGRVGTLRQTVYNIEVEDWHTYYVGKYGVLVHDTKYSDAA